MGVGVKIGIATPTKTFAGMNCKEPPGRDLKEPKECGLIFIPNVTFLSQRKANKKENCSLLSF